MADLFTDDPAAFAADTDLPALVDGNKFFARYYTRIRTHLANLNTRIRGSAVFALIGDLTARDTTFRKLRLSAGTAMAASMVALGAGWGTGASVLVTANGTLHRWRYQITCGTGPAASPTATWTLPDGGHVLGAVATVRQNGGSGSTVSPFWTQPSTSIVVTHGGTPVAGSTYTYDVIIIG